MDKVTLKYALAAATILATVTIAISAFAESSQYQPPARPIESDVRLPAVIQVEQFLNKSGVTGLNNVTGQPAHATSSPAPAAPAAQQPVQPQVAPVVLTAPAASTLSAVAPVRRERVVAPVNPPMIKVAAPAFADAPSNADGTPAQEAAILYAPPVRPPWWERLLSSREFLYAVAFCLIFVPVAGLAAASIIGRRREGRDLAL